MILVPRKNRLKSFFMKFIQGVNVSMTRIKLFTLKQRMSFTFINSLLIYKQGSLAINFLYFSYSLITGARIAFIIRWAWREKIEQGAQSIFTPAHLSASIITGTSVCSAAADRSSGLCAISYRYQLISLHATAERGKNSHDSLHI